MTDSTALRTESVRLETMWATAAAALTVVALVIDKSLAPNTATEGLLTTYAGELASLLVLATSLTLVLRVGILDVGQLGIAGLASAMIGVLDRDGAPVPVVLLLIALVGALYGLVGGAFETSLSLPGSLAVAFGVYYGAQVLSWMILDDTVNVGGFYAGLGTNSFLSVPALLWVALAAWAVAGAALPRRARHDTPLGGRRSEVVVAHVAAGVLAALAGLLLTCRAQAASPLGTPDPAPVVAAALVGGASLYGGRGSLATTLTGAGFAAAVEVGLDIEGVRAAVVWGALGLLATACFAVDALVRRAARV
jgi:ribose/xylose/arabinose/galactoside ABC-type transport system permease subunit